MRSKRGLTDRRADVGAVHAVILILAVASLTACATAPEAVRENGGGTMRPYAVNGVWYYPKAQPDYDRQGLASWYGGAEQQHPTADGEIFDMNVASGAHTTLPLPSVVEVTNLDNGRRIRVRVNDRGPFVKGRIIDLSRQAAKDLGFYERGTALVRVRYVGPAPRRRYAEAPPVRGVVIAEVSTVPY